jgi:N-acetyl-1-D-myo-inositol-2-amino-2-deoxy-alpha-D-glucopyranoside deacetylase
MTADNLNPLRMLVCLAHPDDETFGMGGTLALYARRGVQIHLLCATRGDVGDVDPELLKGFNTVAERRESELRCAAQILGLAGVHFLGYRDSGMPGTPDNQHPNALVAQPVDEVAAKVVYYMRQLQPQVVVTSDPIGGYKHPDHIAIHKATVRAFELAADPSYPNDLPPFKPEKLYYQTMPKQFIRWAVRLAPLLRMDPHHFGRNGDIDLANLLQEGDFPIHARINCRSVREVRDEATACHSSQLGGGGMAQRGPVAFLRRYFGLTETFMRAYPAPENDLHERDLFEGVDRVSAADQSNRKI